MMKLAYTHANSMLVNLVKGQLENEGIGIQLRNEFAQGGAGELSPIDSWLELWVGNSDLDKAKQIIESAKHESDNNSPAWVCKDCGEENAPSFEVCWQCQHRRPE